MAEGLLMNYRKHSLDTRKEACLGRSMADEWRRMYPTNTLARIAQDIGISKKAAESLLAGQFSSTSMGKVIIAYGPGWVAERVMEAAGYSLESYIEQQVAEAERAAAIAREKAANARARLARLQAVRRDGLGLDGQADPRDF